MKKIHNYFLSEYISAIISGIMLTLAFSPFNLYVFAYLSPAYVFYLIHGKCFSKSFKIALFYGLGFGATALYWFFITLHEFAAIPTLLAIILTGLIIFVFSLFYALSIGATSLFNNKTFTQAIAFIVLWMLAEWIRGHYFFSGFPWLTLGFSQSYGWLSQFLPILGVSGLSFLCLIISMAIAILIINKNKTSRYCSIMIIFSIFFIGYLLSHYSFTNKSKKNISVALLQGNIPQSIKWQPSALTRSIERYNHLNSRALKKAQLIIWPESALPLFRSNLINYLDQLHSQAINANAAMVIGIPTQNREKYFNSAITLGLAKGEYNKSHLVPFGEYIPLPWLTKPIASMLHIPMSSFSSGSKHQQNIYIHGMPVSVFICYEIAFPELVRQHSRHAMFLITINDDTWYGSSIALYQHLQMAAVQAKALGRYVLFCSNSGITAIINNKGEIIKQAPIDKIATVYGNIIPYTDETPYARIGNTWIIWICSIALMILLIIKIKRD